MPELISITTLPGSRPANTLSSPRPSTAATMALVGSMVITTAEAAANWRRLSGAVPPICWTKLSATSRRESLTWTGKPARTRQAAIGQPMLPTPTKPTVGRGDDTSAIGSALRAVDFLEHFRGDLERLQAGRDAAIGADLHQDLLDLVARHAVG